MILFKISKSLVVALFYYFLVKSSSKYYKYIIIFHLVELTLFTLSTKTNCIAKSLGVDAVTRFLFSLITHLDPTFLVCRFSVSELQPMQGFYIR